MYIVMIAPECAPVAHAGGLGDVVFGLSRELEIRGHAVEIILPKYQCLRTLYLHRHKLGGCAQRHRLCRLEPGDRPRDPAPLQRRQRGKKVLEQRCAPGAFPQDFRYLMLNGMRTDYSWNYPGQDYLNIYDYIRHK